MRCQENLKRSRREEEENHMEEEKEKEAKKAKEEEEGGGESGSYDASEDLFGSQETAEAKQDGKKKEGEGEEQEDETIPPSHKSWRGARLSDLSVYASLSPPRPHSPTGAVFVQWPPATATTDGGGEGGGTVIHHLRPHPPVPRQDRWDSLHVRMPFSEESLFPVQAEQGARRKGGGASSKLVKRWSLVFR